MSARNPGQHIPQRGYTRHKPAALEVIHRAVGLPTLDEIRAAEQQAARLKWHQENEAIQGAVRARNKQQEQRMTVSLYRSTASGTNEIVVQTNAQSLDVFISGLADALDAALSAHPEHRQQTIAATLKNAFPVAFAIAGYKAEKVSESKLLTCGFASPDSSELVAQSKV